MARAALLATTSALVMALATTALGADVTRPVYLGSGLAVSQPNGKLGAFGGSIDGDTGWGILGAVTVPLQQQWGAQADGMFGSTSSASFWGLAGHLFWRDPAHGLLGLYGSTVDWTPVGAQVRKLGVEGELYNGPWTIGGALAMQSGTFTGMAWSLTGAMYLDPNLRIDATFRFLEGPGTIGTVGVEWLHDTSGLALFANGSWGTNGGYNTLIGGVKFYAGPQKSLIRRHREDDPDVTLPLDLFHARSSCPQVTALVVCIDCCLDSAG